MHARDLTTESALSDFLSLQQAFARSAEQFPERACVEIDGGAWTYRELASHAARIAGACEPVTDPDARLTAVLAYRSYTACAGVMGALFAGNGYVPLHPAFPAERTAYMLARSGARSVVVDALGAQVLEEVLAKLPPDHPALLLLCDTVEAGVADRHGKHRFVAWRDLPDGPTFRVGAPDDIANLLFTSGSTGVPKGVVVRQRNMRSFLDWALSHYTLGPEDRFSHLFELVFDLSGFDLHAAWAVGACVCVPSRTDMLFPARYASSRRLTVWFSVPSTAVLMRRTRMLEPDSLPLLRYALFCGEALLADVAGAFADAAPNAVLENLYGPTELTLACTFYRWDSQRSPTECENGVVPIGQAFPHLRERVIDQDDRQVPVGETGELAVTGGQVTSGYWMDPDRTAAVFVRLPDSDDVWYRTGDRVRRTAPGKPLQYLGRGDHQIKVNGFRVELGEVEAAVRAVTGATVAVVLGWPMRAGHADSLYAFVSADASVGTEDARKQLALRLPAYMVPREVRHVEHLPLNVNGKIDRQALAAMLGAQG